LNKRLDRFFIKTVLTDSFALPSLELLIHMSYWPPEIAL
jgi:hypothetical protein